MENDGVVVLDASGEGADVLDVIGEGDIVLVVDGKGEKELLAETDAVALDVGHAVIDADAVGVGETRTQESWLALGSKPALQNLQPAAPVAS